MPKPALTALLAALLLLVAACDDDTPIVDGGDDDGDEDAVANTQGLVSVESQFSADSTSARLVDALEAAGPVSIVADINHAANAPDSLMLRPTRVILFGNPALGTPLMQAARTTGIDLPQKMLVYEDERGEVNVAYNSPAYLTARHGLEGVDEPLMQIGNALQSFASGAAGGEVDSTGFTAEDVSPREGLIIDTSAVDFETTYEQLQGAIEGNEALTVMAELDHAENAASAGLELPPTRLIVFGNPALGTPLMQAQQSIGIDLPQKMLVWESEDGEVFVAYNDPAYLAERHGLDTEDDDINSILTTIQGALENLSATATAGDDGGSEED